jgi:hypothetical protein
MVCVILSYVSSTRSALLNTWVPLDGTKDHRPSGFNDRVLWIDRTINATVWTFRKQTEHMPTKHQVPAVIHVLLCNDKKKAGSSDMCCCRLPTCAKGRLQKPAPTRDAHE